MLAVAANTGTNLCSMVADLRNGSRYASIGLSPSRFALRKARAVSAFRVRRALTQLLSCACLLCVLRQLLRTEIEAITGRIVTLGQMHNVPTPANALLLQLVKALEAQQTHFCHHPRSA